MDIHSSGQLIHIARQLEYTSRTLQPTKGKKERHVPCVSLIREELEAWIKHKKIGSDDLIFRGLTGEIIDDHSFKRHFFAKDLKESGLRRITYHGFRHTAGTLMISQGIDIKTVQDVLGHEDIDTTMRYVHTLGKNIRQVTDRFSLLPLARSEPAKTVSQQS